MFLVPLVCVGLALVGYLLFFNQQPGGTTSFAPGATGKTPGIQKDVPSSVQTASLKSGSLKPASLKSVSPEPVSPEPVSSEPALPESVPVLPEPRVISAVIAKGDTVAALLSPYLSPGKIHELGQVCAPVFSLSGIRTGQPYSIILQDEKLMGFDYEIGRDTKLHVLCTDDGFEAVQKDIVYEVTRNVIEGRITSSLSLALDAQGEGPELANKMEDILGWDVNFARDIRAGDSFKLLVEKRFRQGRLAGYGNILAATFCNRGQCYEAYRFTDSKGRTSYYDQKGRSMRKAFLKAPLSFTRISSTYSNSRFHPILKKRRPHHGVDYAAPRGTPIKTVGDGVVIARAYSKSAGRYVKIRHTRGYETVYNHMSRYASGLKKGKQVVQGEVIGYVGTSGYATGPHLDFRVKKHGKYINPLTMKSPSTAPVSGTEMPRFARESASLALQLDVRKGSEKVLQATADALKNKG